MKRYGIIGDPVRHSLSPLLHGAAFRKMTFKASYRRYRVRAKALKRFVDWVRKGGLDGFNVTIPHKEPILPTLDTLSAEARLIGAVNTVVRTGDQLYGDNTDARGYILSLRLEANFQPRGKTALILGAGGAARAVVFGLARAGARRIVVCNRTSERANRLAQTVRKRFPHVRVRPIPWNRRSLEATFPVVDLLINATPVGLQGARFANLPLNALKPDSLVSDLVYRPLMTPLIRMARQHGFKTLTGYGMLLHQGALSLKLWTGRRPNLGVMRRALLDVLRAKR